jgi:hypothetical protein
MQVCAIASSPAETEQPIKTKRDKCLAKINLPIAFKIH